MPRDRNVRERRREAILQILTEREVVKEQKDLVEKLKAKGFVATQSSISRDLRDLKIIRVNGYYELPLRPDLSLGVTQVLDEYVQAARIIAPQMILLQVMQGSSIIVSRIINDANWSEVAGTLATLDDKVLVLTDNEAQQKRLFQRLQTFMYAVP
jgi:transcriptional regulator of arginine metabolism